MWYIFYMKKIRVFNTEEKKFVITQLVAGNSPNEIASSLWHLFPELRGDRPDTDYGDFVEAIRHRIYQYTSDSDSWYAIAVSLLKKQEDVPSIALGSHNAIFRELQSLYDELKPKVMEGEKIHSVPLTTILKLIAELLNKLGTSTGTTDDSNDDDDDEWYNQFPDSVPE